MALVDQPGKLAIMTATHGSKAESASTNVFECQASSHGRDAEPNYLLGLQMVPVLSTILTNEQQSLIRMSGRDRAHAVVLGNGCQ